MREKAATAVRSMLSDGSSEVRCEAARSIGAMAGTAFDAEMLQLLYDRDPVVIQQTVGGIRHRTRRHGANPLFLPKLISLLQDRRLKHEAREALIEFGAAAVPGLIHFLNDTDESLWVRRAIPKTIAHIGTPAAGVALSECLHYQTDIFLRSKLIEALALVPLEGAARENLGREIEPQAVRYLRTLAMLYSLRPEAIVDARGAVVQWRDGSSSPSLLEELLVARLRSHLKNLFGLLVLTHESHDFWSAYSTLAGGRPELRGHSLEYLDNTLSGDIRGHVFAAIGDLPLTEKLAQAETKYGVRVRSRDNVLSTLLTAKLDGTTDDSFLVAAALYAVFSDRIQHLYHGVEALRTSPSAFVRETADWVWHRLAWRGAPLSEPHHE